MMTGPCGTMLNIEGIPMQLPDLVHLSPGQRQRTSVHRHGSYTFVLDDSQKRTII